MLKVIFIAVGGASGALMRYGLSNLVHSYVSASFPWGTLAVNLIGCFAIGVLWQVFDRVIVSPEVRALALVGILGGFTTFSTFALETFNLLRDGELAFAISNIAVSAVAGIVLVFVGFTLTKYVIDLAR